MTAYGCGVHGLPKMLPGTSKRAIEVGPIPPPTADPSRIFACEEIAGDFFGRFGQNL